MAESFNPQGQADWLWVPTVAGIADPDAPKIAELAAGVSLGCGVAGVTSPQRTANTIEATPLCADATRTLRALPGITNAELMMLRADTADADNFALFNTMKEDEGATGWLVAAHRGEIDNFGGVEAGDVVDVYPATINIVGAADNAPGAYASWRISFTHNGKFHENVIVAANTP